MKQIIIHITVCSILILFSSFTLLGQRRVVQGTIMTFDSIYLNGARIESKKANDVAYSDTFGLFLISCMPKDKLIVSASGFSKQKVSIEENIKFVFVNMELNPGREDRMMDDGYSVVSDKDKLKAQSRLTEDDTDFSHYRDIYDLVAGRFSGVQFRGNEIIIRGNRSYQGDSFAGSDAALLVVDGNIVDEAFFASLPVLDIASIDVLKPGAASVYGARGGNGAVIVKTKRGKE